MVSPQPAALARVPSYPSSRALVAASAPHPQLQRAPSQQGRNNSHSKSHHSHAQSSPRRRSLPFLEPSDSDTSPYLFDLYDDEASMVRPEALTSGADDVDIGLGFGLGLPDVSHLDAMLADLPPMYDPASAMDELPLSSGASDLQPQLGSSDIECERCWESGTRCADCTRRKQAQFGAHGWPIDSQPPQQPPTFVKQESNPGFLPWSLNADVALAQPPQPQPHLLAEEEKSSSLQLPPLSESLLPAHAATAATAAEAVHPSRLPGRLTRFLPEGVDMAAVELDPHYHTAFAAEAMEQQQQQAQQQQPVAPLRSQRIRRPSARSRSLSPDSLDDRSATPDTFALDSAYETDHLDEQDDSDDSVPTTPVLQQQQQQQPLPQPQQAQTPRPQKKQKTQHTPQPPSQSQQQQSSSMQIQPPSPLQRGDSLARIKPGELADDTISPSALAGAGGSGESSAEPPQPTRLLPVSARDLLPSRPSTAAIPPAHIKDRLVRSAKKLLTAADGANENVQVQVIPLWYPSKGAAGAHKIRLIRVENTADRSVSVYAHAADVGGVVERKSNISRLFGKFDSPQEKMLMNVVGAHNHQVGQESNILTLRGVKKFLLTNKMKSESAYRDWIQRVLLPKLQFDPLEVGDEEVEIEASTNPNQPTRVKPKKLKRSEKKRKAEGEVAATAGTANGASAPLPPSPPSSKRAKLAGGSSSSPPFASSSPFLAHLPAHLQQAFGSHHGHHHPASLAMAHMQPFSIAGLQTDANSSHAA